MKSTDLAQIITHYVNQKGDQVSHKKLQKLVYYVEAWSLVYLNKSLVSEQFEAWIHGPVIKELYQELKGCGYNDLVLVNELEDTIDLEIATIIKENKISETDLELIYAVLDKYAGLSAFQLEMISHSEKPWLDARGNIAPLENCNTIIDKENMRNFYASLV